MIIRDGRGRSGGGSFEGGNVTVDPYEGQSILKLPPVAPSLLSVPVHIRKGHAMEYTVAGSPGKRRVKFACARCAAELESPLAEAGRRFPCPTCGQEFVTPGEREFRQEQQQAQGKREAEAQFRKMAAEAERVSAQQRQQAKADERKRAERAAAPPNKAVARGGGAGWLAASVSGATLLISIAILYVVAIHPLRQKLDRIGAEVDRLSAESARNAADVASLASTVSANATVANTNADEIRRLLRDLSKFANATSDDLTSLTRTVNHNADVANQNGRGY